MHNEKNLQNGSQSILEVQTFVRLNGTCVQDFMVANLRTSNIKTKLCNSILFTIAK